MHSLRNIKISPFREREECLSVGRLHSTGGEGLESMGSERSSSESSTGGNGNSYGSDNFPSNDEQKKERSLAAVEEALERDCQQMMQLVNIYKRRNLMQQASDIQQSIADIRQGRKKGSQS